MDDGNGLAEALLGLDGFRVLEQVETRPITRDLAELVDVATTTA